MYVNISYDVSIKEGFPKTNTEFMTFAIARQPLPPYGSPSVNPSEGQPLDPLGPCRVGLPLDPLGWDLPKLI